MLDGMSRKHVLKMTVDPFCDSFSSRGKKQIVVSQHLIVEITRLPYYSSSGECQYWTL